MFKSLTAPNIRANAQEKKIERIHTTYGDFVKRAKKHELTDVIINPYKSVAVFKTTDDTFGDAQIYDNSDLWRVLGESQADVTVDISQATNPFEIVSVSVLLFFTYLIIRGMIAGNAAGGGNPLAQFTQQFTIEEDVTTKFSDVEGIDGAKHELEEIVEFLKDPMRFNLNGARVPKGAILSGVPGCGKTLLARAIAGESDVPFINVSGSAFVEMFVGVGASRV